MTVFTGEQTLRLPPSVLNITPKNTSFLNLSVDILNTLTKGITIPAKQILQRVDVVSKSDVDERKPNERIEDGHLGRNHLGKKHRI